MESIEKIIEILEKETIIPSEQEYLNNEISSDSTKKAFVDNYKTLREIFKKENHIDPEILGEYVVYKNGDDTELKYISLIAEKIDIHLATCDACIKEYENLKDEFDVVNKHISKRITSNEVKEPAKSFLFFPRLRRYNLQVAVTAVILLIITYTGMFITSEFTTPFYKKNAFSYDNGNNLITRGRTSVLFQKSLTALGQNDFEEAIQFLNEDINNNSNDNSIFYSYYILGLTHLKYSANNILGTIRTFDKNEVEMGIKNLELSIEKNNSGNYDNLNLNAHFYIAKGYLVIDDLDEAKEHLQMVINNRGRYYKESIEIMSYLEKN